MSAVSFYTQNLDPILTVPFPVAVITTDRIADIPDAEITLVLRDYRKEMEVGGFFVVYGTPQIFRISGVDMTIGEDADGTVTVRGQEFSAWLMSTRIWQRDFVPPSTLNVEQVVSFLLNESQSVPPISQKLARWYGLVSPDTPLASCIVPAGDTCIEYLESELEAQEAVSRFKSRFGYDSGQWPIIVDLEVSTDLPVKKLLYTSPELKSLQLSYQERTQTEVSYKITGWYGESPAASASELTLGGLVSEFSYSPAFDDTSKPMDRSYSSIGVILTDAGELDASSLTYDSCRRLPWDAFNVSAARDGIPGGTDTYKESGNLIKVLNPKVDSNVSILAFTNNRPSGVTTVNYAQRWTGAPDGKEFMFFKAWDFVKVSHLFGPLAAPALTIGVISRETYRYIKELYNLAIRNEMDLTTGGYLEAWENVIYKEGTEEVDEEASLQASRHWYAGRGWVYLISIINGRYTFSTEALTVSEDPAPKEDDLVIGFDASAWIPVSRLTEKKYNEDGEVEAEYSWTTNPKFGYFPVLASALEMKQAQKIPPRRPEIQAQVTFAEDFSPAPGTDIQITVPGGGAIEGRVSSLTRSEESGIVTYDAEVEDWKTVGDPEEDE